MAEAKNETIVIGWDDTLPLRVVLQSPHGKVQAEIEVAAGYKLVADAAGIRTVRLGS